jgi:RimJ/RimL family protein N-acetyltransferase
MTLAPSQDRIESERLVLRRIAADDLDFFTRIHADPDVARYIAHGLPRSTQESLEWLQSFLRTYNDFALGQLAVLRKVDGMLIGRCRLSDIILQ